MTAAEAPSPRVASHYADLPASLGALVRNQQGVVTRQQLADQSVTRSRLRANLDAGRWRAVHREVYAVHRGPLLRLGEIWAGLLACGPGAVLSHETAAELDGLLDPLLGGVVHVTVPVARRVVAEPGYQVHYLHRLPEARHPTRVPPRLRVEDTVLGLTDAAPTANQAMAWILLACQRRRTTPVLLAAAMDRRKKMRWRSMLTGAIEDALTGTQSLLESTYLHHVERAHGLPRSTWQQAAVLLARRIRRDALYEAYLTVVELDGRLGHEGDRFRDMRRDNATTVTGRASLRYGWADVYGNACGVAGEVAVVIRARGWTGHPRRCGVACLLPASL